MIGTIRQKPCPTFNLIRKVASVAAGMTAVAAVVAAGACAANWTRRPSRQREVGIEQRQLAALVQMADAVNAGDAGRYASVYAPNAVITIYGSGKLQGRDAIEQHEVELLREFPGTRLAFYTLWQREALAVVRYGVNGKTARGEPMGHEGLLFFRFDPSGLIVEEHRYLDSLTPMAQMGMLGGAAARALPVLPARMEVLVAEDSQREKKNAAVVTATLAAMDSENEPAFLSTLAHDPVVDELIYTEPFTGKQEVAPGGSRKCFETSGRVEPISPHSSDAKALPGPFPMDQLDFAVLDLFDPPLNLCCPGHFDGRIRLAVKAFQESSGKFCTVVFRSAVRLPRTNLPCGGSCRTF